MNKPFRDLSPAQSHFCDIVRFLAALAVALHHTLERLEYEPYRVISEQFHANLGSIGVAIFFLLSGFLIAHTVGRKASSIPYSFREYFVERAVRIYLVYAPAIVLAVGITAFSGSLFSTPDTSFQRLLINLFMLQGVNPFSAHAETFALLGPSWTLNYEFWLYMMFGLAALPLTTRARFSTLGGVLAIAVAYLYMNLHEAVTMAVIWLAGAAIAHLYQRFRMSFWLASVITVGAFAGASAVRLRLDSPTPWDLVVTTAAYIISFGALVISFEGPLGSTGVQDVRGTLAHRLASFSYSLYITHVMWLFVIWAVFPEQVSSMSNNWGRPAVAAVILLVVNLAAWAFAYFTEFHNDSLRRAILRRLAYTGTSRPVPVDQAWQST